MDAPFDSHESERLAVVESQVIKLTADMDTVRDRTHNVANEVQRLVGAVGGIEKMLVRIDSLMAARAVETATLGTQIQTHVSGCLNENARAQDDRSRFRREMRGYMVTILIGLVAAFIAGKLHITLPGP